jgi:hypothetical protein
MSRYSWTIKTAAQEVDGEAGEVYLSLHGLEATTPELKLPASEYEPDSIESGVIEVDGELGELQTGLVRTQGATRTAWPVEWVRIVNLADGREWTAQGGLCDPDGSCPLLRFERTRGPMKAQPPETQPAPSPAPAVRTYEIYGTERGRVVPLSQIVRFVSGVRKLSSGARVYVTDTDSEGFGLGGEPGMWEDLYPGVNPATYGLEADKHPKTVRIGEQQAERFRSRQQDLRRPDALPRPFS